MTHVADGLDGGGGWSGADGSGADSGVGGVGVGVGVGCVGGGLAVCVGYRRFLGKSDDDAYLPEAVDSEALTKGTSPVPASNSALVWHVFRLNEATNGVVWRGEGRRDLLVWIT